MIIAPAKLFQNAPDPQALLFGLARLHDLSTNPGVHLQQEFDDIRIFLLAQERHSLAEAFKGVRSLERLEERQRDAWRQELERLERRNDDERATLRHVAAWPAGGEST